MRLIFSILIFVLSFSAISKPIEEYNQDEVRAVYDKRMSRLSERRQKRIERRSLKKPYDEFHDEETGEIQITRKLHCVGIQIALLAEYEYFACKDYSTDELYLLHTFGVGIAAGLHGKYGYLKYSGNTPKIEGQYRGFNAAVTVFIGAGMSTYSNTRDDYIKTGDDKVIDLTNGSLGAGAAINFTTRWLKVTKPRS